MNKKKFMMMMLGTAMAIGCVTFASAGLVNNLTLAGEPCANGNHVGNHYSAHDATCETAGNKEFWACCVCQQQFLANPGGNWTDKDNLSASLEDNHVAYVEPTGHDYGVHAVVEDGVVNMVNSCSNCGDVDGEPIKSMDAKVNATFKYDSDANRGESYRWSYDENTGVWTSTNKGKGSTSNYLDIVVLTAGTISFDYTSSGEGGYDYMYFGSSASESDAYVNCKGTGASAHNVSSSYSRVVEAGDKLVFVFKKDSSGDKGDDCGTVKFTEGEYTYNVLTLNTNGGNDIDPMFIENGKVVGEIENPTKANAYFEGWFTDEECTVAVTDATTFTGDSTIYAKWSTPLTVTLNANGGTCDEYVYFQTGTTPTIPEPTKDGYVFLGWYTDEEFTTAYADGNASASFTLYAKWFSLDDCHELYGNYAGFKVKPNSSSVSSAYPELSVAVTGAYTLRTAYYSYENGTLDAVNNNVVAASNNGDAYVFENGNIIVMHEGSTFSTSKYLYVLTKNGTTSSSNVTAKVFDKVTFVKFPYDNQTKIIMINNETGVITYDVSIVNSNGVDVDYSKLATISDATMYFVVKANGQVIGEYGYNNDKAKLTSTFVGIKGTFTSSDDKTITFNGNGKAYASFVSSYYAISIEETDTNVYLVGTGTTYKLITVNTDDASFTYTDAVADVTFDANGGVFSDETSQKNADVTVGAWFDPRDKVDTPTRNGYTFNGWWASDSTKAETWDQVLSLSGTYTAHWLKNITVSFHEVDDTPVEGVNSLEVVENSAVGTLPTPTKEGKCFMGWYTDKDFTTAFTKDAVAGTTDLVAYAKWEDPVILTVNYGDANPLVVEVVPGNVAIFTAPTKAGYAIEGYYADTEYAEAVDMSKALTENLTVYVKWMEAVDSYGSYKGFNLYSTGAKAMNFSDFSNSLTVAADGSTTGTKTTTLSAGEGSIGPADRYVYYNANLGIIWTAYGTNADSVGTDTYIFFKTTANISKVDFMRISNSAPYTFVAQITYTDNSTVLFAGYDSVIYDNVTIEGKTFNEIYSASSSNQAKDYTVKDSAGNAIFSK